MAESKAGFAKVVQKHAGRARERLMQNFGKADKTTDELFNTYENNFNRQQNAAIRLQKEMKNYVMCVRAMQAASKTLMDTICETYEPEWIGYEQLPVKAQALELIWEDFGHKLHDQVSIPLNTYISQFSEIRSKIAKRGRKLVDYDSCRHNLEAMHQAGKKRDEMKTVKCKEQLEEAKRLYEAINNELHDELPSLYDSRIPFTVSNLQTVFTAETLFHSENSKIYTQLGDLMDKLAMEHQRGAYVSRKPSSPRIQRGENDTRHYEEIDFKKNEKKDDLSPSTNGEAHRSSSPVKLERENDLRRSGSFQRENNALRTEQSKEEKDYEPVEIPEHNHVTNNDVTKKATSLPEGKKVEELYDMPVGATTTDLPPGVLYRVKATYKYIAEDVDELNFDVGDIIRVTEYEDPEEQEEGWLMGLKEGTTEKGLFPANFTRPI